jgi:hypothetical protein
MSILTDQFGDDTFARVVVPFPFQFQGMDFGNNANGGIAVSSNMYFTFGGTSTVYNGLTATNPGFRTVFVGAKDASWNRVLVHNQVRGGWAGNSCLRAGSLALAHRSSKRQACASVSGHLCAAGCLTAAPLPLLLLPWRAAGGVVQAVPRARGGLQYGAARLVRQRDLGGQVSASRRRLLRRLPPRVPCWVRCTPP